MGIVITWVLGLIVGNLIYCGCKYIWLKKNNKIKD